jgi:hypothetical protein
MKHCLEIVGDIVSRADNEDESEWEDPSRLKLLLDAHIWLWTLQDPKRLGRRVLHQLRDEANKLWLSPISTWEALTLNFKGRIHILSGGSADRILAATAEDGNRLIGSRRRPIARPG